MKKFLSISQKVFGYLCMAIVVYLIVMACIEGRIDLLFESGLYYLLGKVCLANHADAEETENEKEEGKC